MCSHGWPCGSIARSRPPDTVSIRRSDTVQILCKAANVSGLTVRAGFDAGPIGLMWSRDGTQVSTTVTTWLAAVTETAITAHSDGEVVGTLANSAALYRGFYFQVTLDLENGE